MAIRMIVMLVKIMIIREMMTPLFSDSRRIGRPSFGRLRPPPPITPIFYPVPYPVNPARENVGADALALITSFALRGTPQGLGFDLFDLFRRV